MLRITSKTISIFFVCIFLAVLLGLIILRMSKNSNRPAVTPATEPPKMLPIPTYIPHPNVISDSAPNSEIILEWNVTETNIPTSSTFYSVSSIKMDIEKARSIALSLGFDNKFKTLTNQDPVLVWENFGRSLQIHLNSGFVLYSSSQVRGKSDIDGQKQDAIDSPEEALSIANEFIKPLGLSSGSLATTVNQTVLVDSEGRIQSLQKSNEDSFYQITYSYQLDGYPLSLQRGNNEVVKIVVDKLGTVKQLQYWNINPIPSSEPISLISFSSLKSLVEGGGYTYTFINPEDIITPPKIYKISLTSLSFEYLFDLTSPYLFPVFVLSGQGSTDKGNSPLVITVSALKNN